jgi:hypothetical protein
MQDVQIVKLLREKCLEFDYKNGVYPEHQFEGLELFIYITNQKIDEDDWAKEVLEFDKNSKLER